MKVNEYQKLAMTTLNPALDKKDVLINSVMGLCGESGEAIDIVKKWMAQGHELDKEHLVKELGDIAWYLAEAATALDISLEDVFQGNIVAVHQLKILQVKRHAFHFQSNRYLHASMFLLFHVFQTQLAGRGISHSRYIMAILTGISHPRHGNLQFSLCP